MGQAIGKLSQVHKERPHNNHNGAESATLRNVDPQGPSKLGPFSIDEYRPIKVIVIGAGFSGILAAIRFPQKIPNLEIVVYEKNAGVGGTWYNNRYPGVACDVPAHNYQFSFEDKRDWSSLYAPGHEILSHLEDVVEKYALMRYIKLQHEVVRAQYEEPTGKWHVRVRRPKPDGDGEEEFEDVADVLLTAFGAISRWKWPEIDGLNDFKGELHHTASYRPSAGRTWMDDADKWKNKRVGVIGVGSSAIQTVAAIQPKVAHLVNYVRGQTWLALPFAGELFSTLLGRENKDPEDALTFSEEELRRFKTDDEYFWNFRRTMDDEMNSMHDLTQKGTEMQIRERNRYQRLMMEKLAKRPEIAEHLIPEYALSCRRLTPGPGYLEALCEDNVDFITSPIKRFTETGIETEDGRHQELDMVFCATGFDTSWQLPFSIIGRKGVDLNEKWKPHPTSYLSMCVDSFPNMFMSLGPNSIIAAGTLLPILEAAISYAVQATAKIQRERLKSMEVKAQSVRDFDDYLEKYFPQSVFVENCRSWYKVGQDHGRIVGLWPGSNLHATRALEHPRWEDYDYERIDDGQRSLFWLGDGQTFNEKMKIAERAWYLDEENIDRPPVPQN